MLRFALLLLLLLIPVSASAQMSGIAIEILQRTTVSDQPDLEAITIRAVFEPGATTGWHTHAGDEYAVVLDGTLELRSRVRDPRLVSADSAYHNIRGDVHETVNASSDPATITATFIIEKGQPISIPWKEND